MKKKMSVPKRIILFSLFLAALIMLTPKIKDLIKEVKEEPVEYDVVSVTKHVSPSPILKETPTVSITPSKEEVDYEYKLDEFNEISPFLRGKGIDIYPFTSLNSKTLGALAVPGTNIYYPIVSSINDNEWIETDFFGNKSYFGTIFLDYNSEKNLNNDINILYGHNMGNGKMFAYLNRYLRNTNYLDKWNYLFISTNDKIEVYTAFCANQITDENGYYRTINFDSNEEHLAYINKILSEAKFSVYKPTLSDKIVELTTCSSDNDFRSILYFAKSFEIPNILSGTSPEDINSKIRRITLDDEDYRDLFTDLVIYKIPQEINFLRITDKLENNYDWSLESIETEKRDLLDLEKNYVFGLDTFRFGDIVFVVCESNGQRYLVSKKDDIFLVFGTTIKKVTKEKTKTLILPD